MKIRTICELIASSLFAAESAFLAFHYAPLALTVNKNSNVPKLAPLSISLRNKFFLPSPPQYMHRYRQPLALLLVGDDSADYSPGLLLQTL